MITGDLARYTESMQAFEALMSPPGSFSAWHTGVLIARSLNDAFKVVMDNPKMQWVWVMGDDHTYAPDTLLKLLDRELDVVLPLCLNRLPPMDPIIIDHEKQRMKYLEELPSSGLYKLKPHETCGDAGLLVRRQVLEAIPYPWYDNRKSGAMAADDQAFVKRIKDAGFDVYMDLDVQMGHIGHINYVPVRGPDGAWQIRLMGGRRMVAQLAPMARADDAFRIAAE